MMADNINTIHHRDGTATVSVLRGGDKHISVSMSSKKGVVSGSPCRTTYSLGLIEHILSIKGPAYLCDEIRRDEDPSYVQDRLENEIGYFVDLRELDGKRILDFGCGGGASTFCLARLVKDAEIVGVELDQELLSIAEERKKYYLLCSGRSESGLGDGGKTAEHSSAATQGMDMKTAGSVRFLLSPSGTSLPVDIGTFDFIVLSAVYEHLLPDERQPVLAMLWSVLRPGGILFINQTPNRWFPVEQHTTGLPLLNYFPDRFVSYAARNWSKRGLAEDDWATLLRKGIRGGSERGIADELAATGALDGEVVTPVKVGARDGIDLWFRMSSPRFRIAKRLLSGLFRLVVAITGIQLVPAFIVMAVRKGNG